MEKSVYGEEDLLVRKADVCSRLQRAVVDFCQHTYTGITVNDLEVDGIICISFSNSSEQHVVKIHEKLSNTRMCSTSSTDPARDRPNTTCNENVLGNQPSPKCSSEISWRGGTNEGYMASQKIVNNTHSGGLRDRQPSQGSPQDDDNTGHGETFLRINEERDTHDAHIGSPNKEPKLSPKSPDGRQKRNFVESVDGDYVIVKVEPDELYSVSTDDIYNTKADEFPPENDSYACENKPSLVDDSDQATMYMVPSGIQSGNGNYRSSSDYKTRDVHGCRLEDSSVQFVDSQQVSITPNWDFYQNADTNDLPVLCPPQDADDVHSCTSEINRRSSSLTKHFSKNDECDANVFQNFISPLGPLDALHSPVELSSTSMDTSSESDMQLAASLSSQYYNTASGGSFNGTSLSQTHDDYGPKSRSPYHTKSHNGRGRNGALSYNRKISALATAGSSSKSVIKKLKLPVTSKAKVTHGETVAHVQPPSESLVPSPSRYTYIPGDFLCRYCGKGFTMKSTRSRHENTTCSPAGGKSYRCELCSKVFNRSDNRYRHMFKAHGIQTTGC